MIIAITLLLKIIPLYLLIALGFIAGRYLQVQKETVARLLIYIISPAVLFSSVVTTQLSAGVLVLPVIFFVVCCGMCLITYALAKHWWSDATKNILAFTAGDGNTGYFGLPVAMALFGPEVADIVLIAILGLVLYENSLGFFITARGHHTARESLQRLLRLPTIYAFALGLIINIMGVHFGQTFIDFASLFRGSYSVLGMMLIGLGLASITTYQFDFKFIGASLFAKFIAWPAVMAGIILADRALWHIFTPQIEHVIFLLAIVPMAANTVAFATELKAHPEKAALAVLISTLIALVYIPIIASWLLV